MAVENPRGIHPAGGLAAPICGGGSPSTPTATAPWDTGWGEWPEPSPTLRWLSVAAAAGWWDLPPAVKHQAGRAAQGGSSDLARQPTCFSFAKSTSEMK